MQRGIKMAGSAAFAAALLSVFSSSAAIMPLAGKLADVDGKIADGEYDQGITIGPLSRLHPLLKWHMWDSDGDGTVTFLTDGEKLCVAWRVKAWTVDFDGSLKSGIVRRDGPIRCNNDAVELEIGKTANGKRAHFVINPNAVIYDAMVSPGGQADVSWNCLEAKAKCSLSHGWWLVELSLPLASVGVDAGKFYVNAGRSGPTHSYTSLVGYEAAGLGEMIELCARKGAPAVKFLSPGVPAAGDWTAELACGSVPPGGKIEARALIREILGDNRHVSIAADQRKELGERGEFTASFKTNSRAWFRAEIAFTDLKSGEVLMKRDYVTRRERSTSPIPATAKAELGELGSVAVYDYPGLGRARITVQVNPDAGAQAVRGVFAGRKFELEASDGAFTALVESPRKEGVHPLGVAVKTANGVEKFPEIVKIVRRRHEWENNNIGRERVLVPPFAAIEEKGGALEVLLRSCRFGAAALPSSIKAMGRELMAAPAYFEAVIDGKTTRLKGRDSVCKLAGDRLDAEVESVASGDGLTVRSKGKFEYDGFLFSDYALSGLGGRTLERLTLKLPLVDAEMPLMHVCVSDSIRSNPTGSVPAGEGKVWDSSVLGRKMGGRKLMYAAQSVPYLWLGAEKRGLSWFINNTCGLRLDPAKGSVRFVREKGVLTVEIDLVNVQSSLADGHSFAFGFQATPVKTLDKRFARHFQTSMGPVPENYTPRFCVGREIGGFWSGWARRPYGGDWKLFDIASKLANGERLQDEFMAGCKANDERYDGDLKEYCKDLPNLGKTLHFDWVRSCRSLTRQYLAKGLQGKASYPFKYSDPTLNWEKEVEVGEYGSEWISRSCGYTAATRNFLTPSYMDYILYYYKKETELGMKGLYFDDMFPMTCRNPDTVAKLDSDGTWHGNFGILEMRELVKRAAVMQYRLGVNPGLIQIHMTNCLLVPSFAFANSLLSWEDHYGEDVFQKRFRLDYLRAESLGSQLGAESVALDGIKRKTSKNDEAWKKKFKYLTRTQQALLLPAGVRLWQRPPWPPDTGVEEEELFKILGVLGRFEVWADDCVFVPFYEDDKAVGGAPEKVIVGSYRRKGRTLAIFGNLSGETVRFGLSLDRARLGLGASPKISDAESGAELAGGEIEIAPYDVKLVLICGR